MQAESGESPKKDSIKILKRIQIFNFLDKSITLRIKMGLTAFIIKQINTGSPNGTK